MRELSIVIPALNEEEKLVPTVQDLLPECRRELDRFELILINDGSSDRTGEVMERLAKENPEIVVVHHAQRQGLGATYRDGIDRARMEHVTLVPADDLCDKVTWGPFFRAIGSADLVLAYRANQAAARPLYRVVLSRLFSWINSLLFRVWVKDIHSLVIYPTASVREIKMQSAGYTFQLEMLVPLCRSGYSFVEVPMYMHPENMKHSRSLRWSTLFDVACMMSRLAIRSYPRKEKRKLSSAVGEPPRKVASAGAETAVNSEDR